MCTIYRTTAAPQRVFLCASSATSDQQFRYSNHPIRCFTVTQSIHTAAITNKRNKVIGQKKKSRSKHSAGQKWCTVHRTTTLNDTECYAQGAPRSQTSSAPTAAALGAQTRATATDNKPVVSFDDDFDKGFAIQLLNIYNRDLPVINTRVASFGQQGPSGHQHQGSPHHVVNGDCQVTNTTGRLILLTGIARSSAPEVASSCQQGPPVHQHQGSPHVVNRECQAMNTTGRLIVSMRVRRKDASRDRCKLKRLGPRKNNFRKSLKPCSTGLPGNPESPP